MKAKRNIIQYVMLVAGIFMLLSVIVPHHHHDDGAPCYSSLTAETSDGGHHGVEGHDCGCNGHNVALFSYLQQHATDTDACLFLFPLQTLFAYLYPTEPAFTGPLFDRGNARYIESLHDTWISSASGLRAPPSFC